MLILKRNPGESIMIGDDIQIFVKRVRGDQVSIGIEAPRDIQVHRLEVYNKQRETAPTGKE